VTVTRCFTLIFFIFSPMNYHHLSTCSYVKQHMTR